MISSLLRWISFRDNYEITAETNVRKSSRNHQFTIYKAPRKKVVRRSSRKYCVANQLNISPWVCYRCPSVISYKNWLHELWKLDNIMDHVDWKLPCRGEGASHQEVSTQVRQREKLNWASQLKSSDQQIFSTMSSTDSSLIRQD